MNPDFIQLKSIDGELKISHKRRDYGITVSTMEFVVHKPHVNYHIKLQDIISIIPFETKGQPVIALGNRRKESSEYVTSSPGRHQYRLSASSAVMHNRSGRFPMGATQFVLPIHEGLVKMISEFGGLAAIE